MLNPKRSKLRILADETVAGLILEPGIAAFLITHPSLSIEVERRGKAIKRGRTEAALILQYAPSRFADAGAVALNVQRLVTCAAPQYLRELGLPHHPKDLRAKFDALIVSDGLKPPFEWRFENATQNLRIRPYIRAVTSSPSTALALAMAGVGLAQLPECWAIDHVRSGRLIRLLPDWEPTIQLRATMPSDKPVPEALAFVRFVRTFLAAGAPSLTACWDHLPTKSLFSQHMTRHGDGVRFGAQVRPKLGRE